jgi:hypothetical protein
MSILVYMVVFLSGLSGVRENKKAAQVVNPAAFGEIFSERTSSEPHWATG